MVGSLNNYDECIDFAMKCLFLFMTVYTKSESTKMLRFLTFEGRG